MHIAKPLVEESTVIGRASLETVLRTRLPVVSEFPAPGSGTSGIQIHVPVTRESTTIYILTATLEPRVFTEILTQQKLPSDWLGAVFDAQYTTIGRTRDANEYIGKPVGPLLRQTNLLVNEQFLHGVTRDGIDAYAVIKIATRAQPGKEIGLVVNGARDADEANSVYRQLDVATTRFLQRSLRYYGFVVTDPCVREAALGQRAVVEHAPHAPASRCFRILASRLAGLAPIGGVDKVTRRTPAVPGSRQEAMRCA